MRFCPNCGKEMADDAVMCLNCCRVVPSTNVPLTPQASQETHVAESKASVLKSKILIPIIIVAAIIVSFIIFFFTASEYAQFKRTQDEALSIAGEIGAGNNYFELDTKSSQVPLDEMSSFQQSWHLQQQSKAIEAIKFANVELGFSRSLYTRMSQTTSIMGTQREENDDYIVTWSYSPDDGLEVKYQIKTFAMFKIGG